MKPAGRPSAPPAAARAIAWYRPTLTRAHFGPRYWSAWTLLACMRLLALLPLVLSRAIGALLGLLMFALNAKRRRIARVNLRLCFPRWSERKRARALRRNFIVYGQSFTDLAHLAWSSTRRLRRMVHLRGIEHYRALLRDNRRVILLVPHMVGMNVCGTLLSAEHPTFSIAKPLRNRVLDGFLHRGRVRFGAGILAREQGLRPAIHALKQGKTFVYLPDEDLGPRHSVFAPFFGVPTATLPTLGRIAQLTDAVVLPCSARVLPWGRGYEVVVYPPLADFPSGDELDDAAHMNRAFEQAIGHAPEQYLWTFKLFKTRPNNAPSPYVR